MIYVDELSAWVTNRKWKWTRFCHLMADSEDELVRFAVQIGCKPHWIQTSRTGMLHYDLTEGMRNKAIQAGAKKIDRREVYALLKRIAAFERKSRKARLVVK